MKITLDKDRLKCYNNFARLIKTLQTLELLSEVSRTVSDTGGLKDYLSNQVNPT